MYSVIKVNEFSILGNTLLQLVSLDILGQSMIT